MNKTAPTVLGVAVAVALCGSLPALAQGVKRENINPPGLMKPTGYTHVVKSTTFVVNYKPDALPALREVRGAFYGEGATPPASTLLGVQALAREDFLIEIEVVAIVP